MQADVICLACCMFTISPVIAYGLADGNSLVKGGKGCKTSGEEFYRRFLDFRVTDSSDYSKILIATLLNLSWPGSCYCSRDVQAALKASGPRLTVKCQVQGRNPHLH